MKYIVGIVFIISILVFQEESVAQRHRGFDSKQRQRPERLEKFRKMRLIEVLKLNEEEAIRFFAKQRVHEDKTHELMQKRNDLLDEIEKNIREKGNPTELVKLSDAAINIDKDIFAERLRLHDELRKLLTPEQFGKFIVFERDFGRQIRDAMQEMMQDKQEKPPED
ncbi:MAG: hypothetical protein HY800_01695 [Ignavibacteriales bacterium]|nr:hypothetical protein [Ignavibacteriales bacterium]